ncbi:MAG TPA: DUF420 domain-containing protein [bacterium]
MSYTILPTVNAILNSLSTLLLLTGLWFIKNKRREAHRACMVSAFIVSIVFLISYLVHHALAGIIYFQGQGLIRTLYFLILWTHTPLAAAVPVLAILTLRQALKGNFEKHKKLAHITFPIWLYVSVTGVVIYFMLYRMYPAS